MKIEDRVKLLEELLSKGEKDLLIIGQKLEYKSKENSSIRRSAKRLIDKHVALKRLYENTGSVDLDGVKSKGDYKDNPNLPSINMNDIKTVEDVCEKLGDNPVLKILSEEIIKLKNQNKADQEVENVKYHFELDDKYNSMTSDDIIVTTIRLTRDAKEKIDNYCDTHKNMKKTFIISQIIEDFVKNNS